MTGLLGSNVLEVAIGMAFVYLLLAIFCTAANEWIAGILRSRAKFLKQGIEQLLAPPSGSHDGPAGDDTAASVVLSQFYSHPLIKGLMRHGRPPSYLPARTFAKVVMDMATPNQPGSISFDDLENGMKKDLPEGSLKKTLLAVIQGTDKGIEDAQRAIEAWYDDGMDRVSGWYKRRTQIWTFVLAALLTLATNADTVHIARRLWLEPALRSQFVEAAKNAPAPLPAVTVTYPNPNAPTNPQIASNSPDTASDQASATLGEVLGWNNLGDISPLGWFERVVGWLLTMIAVSLGAPFWFDVLNKFMNLRSAGKSPEEKGKPPMKPKMPPVNP